MSAIHSQLAAPAQPGPAAPWIALADLHACFPSRTAAARWWADVDNARKRRERRACFVAAEVRLPDGRPAHVAAAALGRTPAARCLIDGLIAPPGALTAWSERDRQRFLDTHELRRRVQRLPAEFPLLAFRERLRQLAARDAAWLEERGLGRSPGAILRALRRINPARPEFDGNIDRRGRNPADERVDDQGDVHADGRLRPCAPEAWELFRSLFLSANALPLTGCWKFVAGEARDKGWSWPSLSAVRLRVRAEIPDQSLKLRRNGPRFAEANCVPKVERDYESVLAGEWWTLDGRTLDWPCRVPDARREWRAVRLTITGVADLRSRSLKLNLTTTEHSDGILAGLKEALLEWGAPLDILCDNGTSYLAALLKDGRVGSLCQSLGIRLHRALPYHAWAKPIESLWNRLKELLDRWLPHFTGGSPAERPEGRAAEIRASIDALPTLDQAREYLATALREWHATEIGGAGTRGLTPTLLMEHYRGEIRRVDPAVVELQCRRRIGPVERTRNGFRLNHVTYGRWDEDVWRLPAGSYYLLKDPERADRVVVADLDGKPLCEAFNTRLTGATEEERREAARLQARYCRIMRESAAARDYLRETPATQILQAKARHAEARQAEQRKALPTPPPPAVKIVRPDLVEPARRALNAAGATAGARIPSRTAAAADVHLFIPPPPPPPRAEPEDEFVIPAAPPPPMRDDDGDDAPLAPPPPPPADAPPAYWDVIRGRGRAHAG